MNFYKYSSFHLFNFFLINSLLIFNSSCQQIKKDNKIEIGVKKDIPENKQTSQFHLVKGNIEKKIGIKSIEKGFNGMEIRIWFANSSLREHLVILQKTKNAYLGKLYLLNFNYDSTNSLVSIDKLVEEVKPKSGWKFFIDSLFKLKLLTLPDMSSIKGYELGFDGKSITVEVATTDLYRIYSYWEPSKRSEFWQARAAEFISQIIEEELGFKRF